MPQYSSTKVKARNLLTNASYRRFKPEDFEETTFVLDAFTFLVQNLNPIALNRKLKTDIKRNYVKMLWEKCISLKFNKFILTEENYMLLCQTQLTYQKANKIVKKFVKDDDENIALLKNSLKENINTIQFACSSLFPKIYNRSNTFGVKNKSAFDFVYQQWYNEKKKVKVNQVVLDEKKTVEAAGKNLVPYETKKSKNV